MVTYNEYEEDVARMTANEPAVAYNSCSNYGVGCRYEEEDYPIPKDVVELLINNAREDYINGRCLTVEQLFAEIDKKHGWKY